MNTIKVKDVFILILINLFMFQDILQNNIEIFQYFDEFMAVCFLIYYICALKGKIKKRELNIILICLLILILGIIGTARFKYQTNIKAMLTDIFNFFKYIVILLGTLKYFENQNRNMDNVFKYEGIFISVWTVVTLIYMILNTFIGIKGMTYEVRYGIRAFQFIYGHAGTLNTITTYFCIFTIVNIFRTEKNRKYIIILILNLIILMSTLRARAFVSVAMICLLMYIFYIRKNKKMDYRIVIPIVVILVSFIAMDQVENYFLSGDRTPRSDLLKGSITLMKESFPTGTGWATFGSYAASKYYSTLYYRFNFNNYYGMNPKDTQFLTDDFWPIVIGQFGVIGVILYVILLYMIFKLIWNKANNNMKKCISTFIMANMLFNSMASSSFVHYTALAYMFFLAIILEYNMNNTKGENHENICNNTSL